MTNRLQEPAISRRRWLALLVTMVLVFVVHGIFGVHDALLLAALVLGAGVLWSTPGRKAWLVALGMAAAGLGWSSIDPYECSVWWRGRAYYEKLAGHLPYITWDEIRHKTTSGCSTFYEDEREIKAGNQLLGERQLAGKKLELYQTPLGSFWVPAPGKDLMAWLVWELTRQHDYESGQVVLKPGDIVVDGGAHVGTFTRLALARGAARVIAVEPEPINIACLEANLGPEIASGRVTLVKAGIWNEKTYLTLADSADNSAGHSFVREVPDSSKLPGLPVVTLDSIVEELRLDRVDFIKMDIEGSERRALEGARQTLARFRPRMAICSYHLADDPVAIPAVAQKAQPAYRIHAKDYEPGPHRMITKVLFFE